MTRNTVQIERHPALALLEFSSAAVGTRAADALLKKAPVTIRRIGTLQPGKFAILFSGEVAAVEESHAEGRRWAEDALLDQVLLPDVHPRVYDAVLGRRGDWHNDTLGIIESTTLAAVIAASDAAVKGANVEMVEIRLGDGLGGKGLAHFSGEQADVQAAIEIGRAKIFGGPACVQTAIIAHADDVLTAALHSSTRFWGTTEPRP